MKSYIKEKKITTLKITNKCKSGTNQGVDSGQEYRVHLSQSGVCKRR